MNLARRILYAGALTVYLAGAGTRRLARLGTGSLSFSEALGATEPPAWPTPPLWLHAVSVGELRAGEVLLDQLCRSHPQLPILITCTTEAARRYATDTMQLPVYR
ncbi:MAG: 3-deoxy-D-manno-octulosonic acid transferase, partial [Betaproteobacteria bacterium]|nr:3-deoxy-D-manno-octulosonic acid transferase [Betaproteobacteria bacterium]